MLIRKIEDDSIIFYDGALSVLTIHEKETEKSIVLVMKGELRSDAAHDVLDELIALATIGADLVVDLKEVTYIAPTTQHVFLRVQQKMDAMKKGSLTLKNFSDTLYREFEKTGVSELLAFEK